MTVHTEKFRLTGRQKDVLGHLVTGKSNKEIAHAMGLSEKTVKAHCTEIFKRLAVHTRTQCIVRVFSTAATAA